MNYNITSTSTPNSLKTSYTFITIITFTINIISCKHPGSDNYVFTITTINITYIYLKILTSEL